STRTHGASATRRPTRPQASSRTRPPCDDVVQTRTQAEPEAEAEGALVTYAEKLAARGVARFNDPERRQRQPEHAGDDADPFDPDQRTSTEEVTEHVWL